MSTTQPLFTIATITYNSGQWVKQTIDSILASSFTDFELLISDDGSTDDTWSIIQQYNDPRIRAWRNEINMGEYPNRNKVLVEAKGRYILYVDGDDMLYRQTLRNLSEYVESYPEAVSVWGVWSHQMNFCFFPVLLQPLETMKWIYAANLPIAVMGFGETLFKTEALLQTGGFSNRFVSGDMYIKKKIALDGPVLLVPIGLMYWRRSEGQASNRLSKKMSGYYNNVLIDREILEQPFFKDHPKDLQIFKNNIGVRNIKILVRNTFLKLRIKLGVRLFRELKFQVSDMVFLFQLSDFSYLNELNKKLFNGNKSTKL